MKEKPKTHGLNNRGKSRSAKMKAGPSKPTRAKRIRPLAPKQFVDIIEHMNDGLVVLDKDWHYIYVNQKAAAMLQRQKPSDLIGKHIWTEYPEGVGQPFQLAYEKAMKEQTPIVFEDHYEPWDLWFENRIYPSPDSLLILFTEITDRKRIERLLNERQYLLQKILDTEPGTVYIYDLEEQRNVYINRYWLLTYGYTEEETQAMGDQLMGRIIHPDDLAHVFTHHENWQQEHALESEVREIEFRVRTKTGEWRWLHSREVPFTRNERGRVKQILGITQDVTEHKQAEEAVQEQNRFISALAETTPGLVYVYDWQTGSNVYSNRGNEFLLGYTSEEVKNMGTKMFAQLLHPDDGAAVVASQQRLASASDQDILEIDYRLRHSNGEWRWLRSYERPFARSKDGSLKQKIGIAIDITERKHMEEAILKEKDFSDAMLNSLPGIFYFYDKTGKFLRWNKNLEIISGYSGKEIAQMHPLDFFVGAEKEYIAQKIQEVFEIGESDAEANFVTKTGQLIQYYFTGKHIEIESVPYLIGMGIDITQRKQVEKALRESEEKFSKVFYASPIPLSINRLSDGRYVDVNDSFLKRLGFQRDELVGKTALELGAWVDPEERKKMFDILSEQGSLRNFEAQFRTKSGETGIALLFREVVELAGEKHFIGTNLDITDRKRTEEALAASEAELRALFAAMDDVVLVIDRNGVYQKITPTNPNLLYKPPEELLGKTLRDVFPASRAESFIDTIRQVLETRQTARIEYELIIDGLEIWFDTSISAMDADHTLWMARDITDRKRAEEELRQLNEELEGRIAARTEELAAAMIRAQESDRLKTAFLASMSHELRTPLNSIIGFTGVILQGLAGPLNEEQTKQLNMTRDSARHLLSLINDVLDISKIEAGQLEIQKRPFDIRQAIESALRVVHPLAQKKNLQLVTSIGSDVGIIDSDRRRVEQVLINLVGNSIKFTEQGDVSIQCQIRNGWLETSVHDHGIGIKPEDMDKLFKPFQQIDTGPARGHEGTGLGLAICKRLVVAMGGEITVESQWRIGSTFKFTLPT